MISYARLILIAVALSVLSAFDAGAQTPSVTTDAATGVTDIAATLNGSVSTVGTTLYTFFEWGTTIAYGSSVSASPGAVSGINTASVTALPWGLQPGTTYHYRLQAQYSDGTPINGSDMTFTTGAAATPPTITGTVICSPTGKTQEIVSVQAVSDRKSVV